MKNAIELVVETLECFFAGCGSVVAFARATALVNVFLDGLTHSLATTSPKKKMHLSYYNLLLLSLALVKPGIDDQFW